MIMFGILGDLTQQITQGPKEVILGLVTGIGWGIISSFLPHRDDVSVVINNYNQITLINFEFY